LRLLIIFLCINTLQQISISKNMYTTPKINIFKLLRDNDTINIIQLYNDLVFFIEFYQVYSLHN